MMSRLIAVFTVLVAFFPVAAQDKKKPAPKIEPRVIVAVPLGAAPGKATKLTLRGVDLDSARDVKLVAGKGAVKILGKGKAPVPDKNPEKVGDTQVEIELKLEAGSEPASLMVVTANGETKPHGILADPAFPENEPNDGFRAAHAIPLPITIQGTIGRQKDVDVVRFDGKQGHKLVAEVLASRHGSPLDSILTLYDARGTQIATSDDFTKEHRDARIEITLPADGVYYLSLIDAHDTGSALHVYRLTVK